MTIIDTSDGTRLSDPKQNSDRSQPVIVIGAGIFGLSTAIHLAKRHYTDITVYDRQPYHETLYDYQKGCDAASADNNKVIRASYGHETWYRDLTLEAIREWEAWNQVLSSAGSRGSTDGGDCGNSDGLLLPPGMTPQDRIYVNCGHYHVGDSASSPFTAGGGGGGGSSSDYGDCLSAFEKLSIENLKKAGLGHTQYLLNDPVAVERARADGYGYGVDPFRLAEKGEQSEDESKDRAAAYSGYLDMIGGFVYADKACRFALHQAQRLGVKFVLDKERGNFVHFLEEENAVVDGPDQRKVIGIQTADGRSHFAQTIIVACGGWTPSILPELDGLCETTAGSVAMIQIPLDNPLIQRFLPQCFPVWQYKSLEGTTGLYGFPVDGNGIMKLGFRGVKYTNPQPQPNERIEDTERSIPITRWSIPSINQIPLPSIAAMREFLDEYLPELGENGLHISQTRLCWYTDSFDNHFVIDRVPTKPGIIVATGGSGHAFKFLPTIGRFVVDRVENLETDPIMKLWRWRRLEPGQNPVNRLGKGSTDSNALQNVAMSTDSDLDLSDMSWKS